MPTLLLRLTFTLSLVLTPALTLILLPSVHAEEPVWDGKGREDLLRPDGAGFTQVNTPRVLGLPSQCCTLDSLNDVVGPDDTNPGGGGQSTDEFTNKR